MKQGSVQLLLVVSMMVLVSGCASRQAGDVYSRSQAQRQLSVYYGTILAVNSVTIEGTQTGLGSVAGGALGGIAGHSIGGGHGQALGTVAGVIGGALLGSVVEEGATRQNGVEITVELDSGEVVAVVQAADDYYAVGDRVRLVRSSGGMTRVRQ